MLNVGLSAGILSQRVFSMFVLEALLLTFMTTSHVLTELVGVGDLRVIRSCCTHAFILLEHFCVSNAYIL